MSKHIEVYTSLYIKRHYSDVRCCDINCENVGLIKTYSCVLPYDPAINSLFTASNITMINEREM